jgi:hypothetical protein
LDHGIDGDRSKAKPSIVQIVDGDGGESHVPDDFALLGQGHERQR